MFYGASDLVTWQRISAYVVEPVAPAASLTVVRQPYRPSRVSVTVTGSPSGTVTVAGTVAGSPDTEVLSWGGTQAARETTKVFSAISGVTTSLTGGTTLTAKAVGADGSPQQTLYTVKGPGHPVTIQESSATWKPETQGAGVVADEVALVAFEEVWTPRVGDRVTSASMTWEVLKVDGPLGGLRPTHWECGLKRLDGKGAQ